MFTSPHGKVQRNVSFTNWWAAPQSFLPFGTNQTARSQTVKYIQGSLISDRTVCSERFIHNIGTMAELLRAPKMTENGFAYGDQADAFASITAVDNTNTSPHWNYILRARIWTCDSRSIRKHHSRLILKSVFGLTFATEVSEHLIYSTAGISSAIITLDDFTVLLFHRIQRRPYCWFYRTGCEQAKQPKIFHGTGLCSDAAELHSFFRLIVCLYFSYSMCFDDNRNRFPLSAIVEDIL